MRESTIHPEAEARPRSSNWGRSSLRQQQSGGHLQNSCRHSLPAKMKQRIPMAFLRDACPGKLEVLRGLRPAATLLLCKHQLGVALRIHTMAQSLGGGTHSVSTSCGGGSVCFFLNISKSSEEQSQPHTQRRISKKWLFFFFKRVLLTGSKTAGVQQTEPKPSLTSTPPVLDSRTPRVVWGTPRKP